MNDIPNLNNLIKAFTCNNWCYYDKCEKCPYGYEYLDERGDYPYWTCNEEKLNKDALFYLKLYQYLIEEKENG